MYRRFGVLRWFGILCLVGCCFVVGVQTLFYYFLLAMAEGAKISNSSQTLKVFLFSVGLLSGIGLLEVGITCFRFLCVLDIKKYIQRVVNGQLSHKNFSGLRKKVSEHTENVDELIDLMLKSFFGLAGAFFAALCSVAPFLFCCLEPSVAPVLLALIVVALKLSFMRFLSCWCKKSLCFSNHFNAHLDFLKDLDDFRDYRAKEKNLNNAHGRKGFDVRGRLLFCLKSLLFCSKKLLLRWGRKLL